MIRMCYNIVGLAMSLPSWPTQDGSHPDWLLCSTNRRQEINNCGDGAATVLIKLRLILAAVWPDLGHESWAIELNYYQLETFLSSLPKPFPSLKCCTLWTVSYIGSKYTSTSHSHTPWSASMLCEHTVPRSKARLISFLHETNMALSSMLKLRVDSTATHLNTTAESEMIEPFHFALEVSLVFTT